MVKTLQKPGKSGERVLSRRNRRAGANPEPVDESAKSPAVRPAKVKKEKRRAHQRKVRAWAAVISRFRFADKLGWYTPSAPGIASSTRQAEALHIAVAGSPTTHKGLLLGIDTVSGWMLCADPFSNYNEADGVTSPNVCIIGPLGRGKSSMLKTWAVLRNLTIGRRVVVVDKKPQKFFTPTGELVTGGEYTKLCWELGVEPIRFTTDGTGTRINILDSRIAARISATEDDGTDGAEGTAAKNPAGQAQMLRVVLAEAMGRALTPKEGKALRVGHAAALAKAKEESREAILPDLVDALYAPDEAVASTGRVSVDELKKWGQSLVFELERMIEDDLQGILDGPTSPWVNLNAGLTVFDVSALPEDGPALSIVMMIINTWLTNVLAAQARIVPTILVIEEAWHLVQGSYAAVTRRNTKLSRALGMACYFAFHHVSDIPKDSPALAMLRECGMKLFYGEDTQDEAEDLVRLFRLPPGSENLLYELEQGEFIFKIGSQPPVRCLHIRSDLEIALTNTDEAMTTSETFDGPTESQTDATRGTP